MKRCFFILFVILGGMFPLGHSLASEDKVGVSSEGASLSPTGTEVVFSADFDGPMRLWISRIDGGALRRLSTTPLPTETITHMEPAWSPDGRQIAYVHVEAGAADIWVIQVDGSNPTRLTAAAGNNTRPAWTRDGTRIAFVSDRAGTKDIWIMNATGAQQARLTTLAAQENAPSLSPSGDKIVFSATDNDAATLMTVNVDGSGLRPLTTGNFQDWEPNWGSNGIVFSSNRDTPSSTWKIWTVLPDGSGLRKLGDLVGHDPVWMRDGRVVFTDELLSSRARSAVSIYNPATGSKRVVVDIQGYTHPIDIRPGKNPNRVNPNSQGRMEVAILSTRTLDATKAIKQETITFGRTGNENSLSSCLKTSKDVNGDGLPDLVCRFILRHAAFQPGSSSGILRFIDSRGVPYEGRDVIATTPQDDPDDFRD